MMTQAFYTGISSLQSNQTAIDVISDNLANVSTNGFRGYSAEFSSLFENALNSTSANSNDQVGVGTRISATTMNMQNGSAILTERNTDLAISGDGWFGVQSSGTPLYTRDGSFSFDANDNLVTGDGFHVLGTMGGNISNNTLTKTLGEVPLNSAASQEKLQFPKYLTYPAQPTTNAKFFANLGLGTDMIPVGAGIVDSKGNKNNLQLEFTKSATQTPPGSQWDVVATTKSSDGLTTFDTKKGSVSFGETGDLLSTTLTTIDNNGTNVAIDLGSGYGGVVTTNGIYKSGSSIVDGTVGGDLEGYSINKNGEVLAAFTNGLQSSVGKIAVYHFQNDQGLDRVSGTRFSESSNSGKAIFFKDANGKDTLGANIMNFKLEGSNVQMSTGLTDLIIHQKAYDASSKCVTTADQMIQKALSMHK
ncbi:MAG: flagellar hook-basal body complex protein [Campylobacterales bacterium]|nr:flagellar hook-basal body complex protein [Campylobacterales bacterium]